MIQRNSPTAYPEVNVVLKNLLAHVQAILEDQVVGLYLYGSLATGDFEPSRIDIDFVVVTKQELPKSLITRLEAMHQDLATGSGYAAKLEGTYIPLNSLRRYEPNGPECLIVNEGCFYMAPQGSDWIIQQRILREFGINVWGPPMADLIDPVHANDLRWAVQADLREWWAPMLQNPSRLNEAEYQPYAALSMCRALYTMEHGAVVSKTKAAIWVENALGSKWATLIRQAAVWRRGEPRGSVDQTLRLMEYVIEQAAKYQVS